MLLISLVVAIVGCGKKSRWEKVVLEGEVTFDGNKVTNGDIRFIPAHSSMGPTAGADIVDGHYRVTNKGGVPVGKHRVVLRAFIIEGVGSASGDEEVGDLLGGPAPRRSRSKPPIPVYQVEGRPQFLPPAYNSQSPLTVEVTGEENPQKEDFNMKSTTSLRNSSREYTLGRDSGPACVTPGQET
jgi:hypothetical protein